MGNAGRWAKLLAAGAVLALSACAPAPLYISARPIPGAVTYGEIPRDAYGEPVWSAIPPLAGSADGAAPTS